MGELAEKGNLPEEILMWLIDEGMLRISMHERRIMGFHSLFRNEGRSNTIVYIHSQGLRDFEALLVIRLNIPSGRG